MPMSLSTDDFDVEAAFEAELARLKLEDPVELGVLVQSHVDCAASSSDLDDDDVDSTDPGEPESLQLLRTVLERRECAAEEFGREWRRFCVEIASLEPLTAVPGVVAHAPVADLVTAEGKLSNDTPSDALVAADVGSRDGGQAVPDGSGTDAGLNKKLRLNSLPDTAEMPLDAYRHNDATQTGTAHGSAFSRAAACRQSAEQGLTCNIDHMDKGMAMLPSSNHALQSAASGPGSKTSLVDDREQKRLGSGWAAAVVDTPEEALLERRQQELEEQRLRALAELDAALARAAAERQAEIAAAAEEQSLLAAEAEATSRRLEMALTEAAEREALREATLAALRQEQLEMARQRVAALQISHAWRRYANGPVKAARRAAVVCIQAAWRGHVSRRQAAELRAQRTVLQDVEEAARAGQSGRLDMAIRRAYEFGLKDVVQARLAALETAAGDAATKLRTAAASGSYLDYRAAMCAAQAFPSLAQLVRESSAVFERRQSDAEAAVFAAITDEPISSCYRLMESAAHVGIEPQRLATALETVRQRDQQLITQLAAASTAQGVVFNMTEFVALAERAARLGLKGDASAARMAVERRRRTLAASLRLRASAAADAAECLNIVEEARRMGLLADADALLQRLQSRQRDVQAALGRAVTEGTIAKVVVLLQHAFRLELPPKALRGFGSSLRSRQWSRLQALVHAAGSDSLDCYLAARGAGVHSGVELRALLDADRVMATRRDAAATSLVVAAAETRIVLNARPLPMCSLAEALAPAVRLGKARAVLERASKRVMDRGTASSRSTVGAGDAGELIQQRRHRSPADQAQGSSIGRLAQDVPQSSTAVSAAEQRAPHYHVPLPVLSNRPPDVSGVLELTTRGPIHGSGRHHHSAGSMSDFDSWLYSQAAVWPPLKATIHLGISDAACLMLCVLDLKHLVCLAKGVHSLRGVLVARNYWGMPLLPTGHTDEAGSLEGSDPRVDAADLRGLGSDGTGRQGNDDLLDRVASLLRLHQCVITLNPLVFMVRHMALSPLPQAGTNSRVATPGVVAQAEGPATDSATSSSTRPGPTPDGCSKSLTQAVIIKNVPEANLSRHGTGASSLSQLCRLDLGLECLSSLQGLDVTCPRLRILSADANRLSSLDGLARLPGLHELSLKQNQLVSLLHPAQGSAGRVVGALPPGSSLRRLALDSNKLSGTLRGLSGCSGLRILSLADNSLTDLGSELEACTSELVSLSVRRNYLTSLHRQLMSLTRLRELDVSGNHLTTLDGVQGLLLLQSLRASGNAITSLPQPLCLPYLTVLDLGRNSFTAFGAGSDDCGGQLDCPRLQRLVLHENSISRLGSLGPMMHLTFLDLSFNNLASLDAVHAVTHLVGLRCLNVSHNPVTDQTAAGRHHTPGASRWPGGLAKVALGQLLVGWRPAGTAASSSSSAQWPLPCLQELNLDSVGRSHRLASVVRASTGSPFSAVAGIRRARASSVCFLVFRVPASVASSIALGRRPRAASPESRQAVGGLAPQRPLMRFVADLRGPSEPVATRSLLVAATGPPFGSTASAGLHAEATVAVLVRSQRLAPSAASVHLQPNTQGTASAPSVQLEAAGSAAAGCWLSRVRQAWHVAAPFEALGLQNRLLTAAQRGKAHDDPAVLGFSDGSAPLSQQLVAAVGLPLTSSSLSVMGGLVHGRAEILDFAAMRCFRPLARSTRFFTAAGALGQSNAPERADAAQLPGRAVLSCDSETAWALITEARERAETCLSVMELALTQELKHQLQGRETKEMGSCVRFAPARGSQACLTARPSYILHCMCEHASRAATVIQAVWKGLRTRRLVLRFRLEAGPTEGIRRRAATTIQAWWRGYCVRRAKLLSALREAAQQSKAESCRREAAAITVQAHFRGYLVRRNLRNALAAVRLPTGSHEGSDLDYLCSGDLDEMMEGLAPIEKLLIDDAADGSNLALLPSKETRKHWPAMDQSFGAPAQQQGDAHGRLLSSSYGSAPIGAGLQSVRPAAVLSGLGAEGLHTSPVGTSASSEVPLSELQRAGISGHIQLPLLQPQSPLLQSQSMACAYPSPQALYMQRGVGASAAGQRQHCEMGIDPNRRQHEQGIQPGNSMPVFVANSLSFHSARLPPISLRSSTSHSTHPAALMGSDDCAARLSPQFAQESVLLSPGFSEPAREGGILMMDTASAEERVQQHHRHLERLKKLMAEWGFTDLSTAEAYYRRSQRQKQGNSRRKVQGRHHEQLQRHPAGQQKAGACQQSPTAAFSKGSSWPHPGSEDGFCSQAGPTESPAAAARILNSADGVLISDNVGPVGGLLRGNRSASQGGRNESHSADSISASGSGRLTLAPLAITSAIKLPQKTVAAQRPRHLPALANNNWVASSSPQSQPRGAPGAKGAGEKLAVTGSSGAVASRGSERPATVQSVDSTPDVLMI